MKNQYIRGLPKQRGLGQFADFREGLANKRGCGVFEVGAGEGGVISQCTLCIKIKINLDDNLPSEKALNMHVVILIKSA